MNATAPVVIQVDHLSLNYGPIEVLSDLSFSVRQSEFKAIVGPNGCGKSTLLKSLVGLIPHKGSIAFPRNSPIGYLPQHSPLDFQFPIQVDEFVGLGLWGKSYDSKVSSVENALKQMNALDLIHRPFSDLSRGQFQRICLARTIVHSPEILILDEPLTGLDEATSDFLMEYLVSFREKGGTVLMVMHDEFRRKKYQAEKIDLEQVSHRGTKT